MHYPAERMGVEPEILPSLSSHIGPADALAFFRLRVMFRNRKPNMVRAEGRRNFTLASYKRNFYSSLDATLRIRPGIVRTLASDILQRRLSTFAICCMRGSVDGNAGNRRKPGRYGRG